VTGISILIVSSFLEFEMFKFYGDFIISSQNNAGGVWYTRPNLAIISTKSYFKFCDDSNVKAQSLCRLLFEAHMWQA